MGEYNTQCDILSNWPLLWDDYIYKRRTDTFCYSDWVRTHIEEIFSSLVDILAAEKQDKELVIKLKIRNSRAGQRLV